MILTAIGKCNTSRSVVDTTFFNSGYLMGTLTGDFFSSEKKTLFIIFIIHFTRFFFRQIVSKFFSPIFQNLDLSKRRLIYDGPLTMKLGDTKRFKTIDLHVVLLEDCIMLLQKQDDKYLLKFHTTTFSNAAVGSQGNKLCHSPVIKFSTMLVRPVATGKKKLSFCVFGTYHSGDARNLSLFFQIKGLSTS